MINEPTREELEWYVYFTSAEQTQKRILNETPMREQHRRARNIENTVINKYRKQKRHIYQEEGFTFEADGKIYDMNKVYEQTSEMDTVFIPFSPAITWILSEVKDITEEDVMKVDYDYPILVVAMDNKWYVIDGIKRMIKAILEHKKGIRAIDVPHIVLANACVGEKNAQKRNRTMDSDSHHDSPRTSG